MTCTRIIRSALRAPSGVRRLSTTRSLAAQSSIQDAYILSAARTATAKFNGGFKDVSATTLGSHVVKAALSRAGVPGDRVSDVYMGNVLQAGVGQSPARQVVVFAGLPHSTEAVTINKVCASGLKAVVFAVQNIQLGNADVQVAGGMENMTRVPYYLPRNKPAFGHFRADDGLITDGLWDVYNQIHMGNCAENTAKKLNISREAQDAYAVESYRRAGAAWGASVFEREIVPVEVPGRKGSTVVKRDEEYDSIDPAKIKTLRPAFQKEGGTVTAANASTFSDGASALVLGSAAVAREFASSAPEGMLARIVAHADAATAPIDFPLAPTLAIPKALQRAGLAVSDIARWEINEAFAAVSVAVNTTLDLPVDRVNVNGGAISLGHALGSSGSRILTSLLYQLKDGEFGVAAICNGGGGATAVVVQKIDRV